MRFSKPTWYGLGFVLIDWLQASIQMLSLGTVHLHWTFHYAKWSTFRKIRSGE